MIHRLKRFRYRIRTVLLVVFLAALFFNFVIAPEIQRTNDFSILKANGMIWDAPSVVLFGGGPQVEDPIPEPFWFRLRQRIAKALSVRTVPWICGGSFKIPEDSTGRLAKIVNSHADFKIAAGKWREREDMPLLDLDDLTLPAFSASADPNEASL